MNPNRTKPGAIAAKQPVVQGILHRQLVSGARGRELESPRSDQFNQRLAFELGTLGDVFGDVFISKKISLHTFTKRVRGKNSQYSS